MSLWYSMDGTVWHDDGREERAPIPLTEIVRWPGGVVVREVPDGRV